MKTLLSTLLLCSSLTCMAQEVFKPDSTFNTKRPFVTWRDTAYSTHTKGKAYIIPTVLVAYGAASFVIKPIRNVDYYFRAEVANRAPNFESKASDYLQLGPAVLVYGLNLAGYRGRHNFVDRTATLALAGLLLTGADGLKFVAKRTRPYGDDPLSFPSGHTGAAFLTAEFLAQEYGDRSILFPIIGYTAATATAVLRVYNKAHWFSDCVAGAGLGILSTKAAYVVYPIIRKALSHESKNGKTSMILPFYQEGMAGFTYTAQL